MQPNTPPVSTPEVPAPQATPDNNQEPIQPANPEFLPNSEPPKKSNKKKIIITSVIAVLVLIIGAVLGMFLVSSQAKTAATEYDQKVLAHVKAIRAGPEHKDRLDELDKKVSDLPAIPFAGELSTEYKEAEKLESRYNALLDETGNYFREVYTFFAFTDYQFELNDLLRESLGDTSNRAEYAKSLTTRADKCDSFLKRLESFYFDEKYRANKADAVTYLKTMCESYRGMADVQSKEATDSSEASMKLYNDGLVQNLGGYRAFLNGTMYNYSNELKTRLVTESKEVDDKYENFIKSLE